MLPPDYSRKLRRVEVRARLVSEQLLGGRLGSIFKGRGMDFADVREYVPGDDVRRIDWNVTARLRKPFIKRHIEERELVVMLLVDMSGSSEFETANPVSQAGTKREMAAILAGALAFGAVRQGDCVGCCFSPTELSAMFRHGRVDPTSHGCCMNFSFRRLNPLELLYPMPFVF